LGIFGDCRSPRFLHEETPAQRDAAEAGAAAARLSKADGQSAQRQLEAAAVAAGRAATNGGMDPVGAEEASRKAATCHGHGVFTAGTWWWELNE